MGRACDVAGHPVPRGCEHLTTLIDRGAPGWFHLLVLLCIWNAFKFLAMGPVSVVRLVRARTAERRDRRMLSRSPAHMACPPPARLAGCVGGAG